MRFLCRLQPFITALRPWTLSASLAPVLLGAVLCYKAHGEWSILAAVFSAGAVLAVHAAGNLVNTYFDFIQGVDAPGEATEDRTLVDEHLSPSQVANMAAFLYGCGMALLWLLTLVSPARSEHLAGLFFGGLSSSFLYTGGIGLKYYVLGDLVVIITFGPLAVLFSFVAQCGHFSFAPLLVAIPLALNTEAFIHSKHARDIKAHHRAGIISLAVLLGQQGSYFLFTLLLFLPYFIFLIWATQYSLWFGLPAVTMFFSFPLERTFREDASSKSISHSLVWLNLFLGLLLIIACYWASDIPLLS